MSKKKRKSTEIFSKNDKTANKNRVLPIARTTDDDAEEEEEEPFVKDFSPKAKEDSEDEDSGEQKELKKKKKKKKKKSQGAITDGVDKRTFFDLNAPFEKIKFKLETLNAVDQKFEGTRDQSFEKVIEDGFKKISAEECARWLVFPYKEDMFQSKVFEKKCFARCGAKCTENGFGDLLRASDIAVWLKEKRLTYGTNVDVTSYKGGVRSTHNSNDGFSDVSKVADYATVMKRFQEDKCSVRVLHPQRWSDKLWTLLSNLENFWQSPTGCNAYWTPPNSQGFAPHWDDIDAFVLQLEGTKRWRLYPSRDESEKFPRFSSQEFSAEERKMLESLEYEEVILNPGDLLYMPRGTIHEAFCVENSVQASLHLTISVNQKNTFADILEHAFSDGVADAVNTNVELRRCPPRDFLRSLSRPDSANFENSKNLLERCCNVVVDNMMKNNVFSGSVEKLLGNLMRERVRPPKAHTRLSSHGKSSSSKLALSSRIGLVQKDCASLEDCDDGFIRLRTYINNDRKLHMEDASSNILDEDAYREASSCMRIDPEIEADDLDALATVLYAKYEDGVEVKNFPFDSDEEKVTFARKLIETNVFCILN